MESNPNDKGVRKFRAMIFSQCVLFTGFAVTGALAWSESLFEILVWGVFGSFLGFAVPNVVEKLLPLFSRKPKGPTP